MNRIDEKNEKPRPSFSIKRKDFSIFVAQAELFTCEVLCQLLKQQGYNVVGKAVELEETVQQIRVKRPQCVILESEISGKHSVDVVRQAQTGNQQTKFILYTSRPDIRTMVSAMQSGFYGFLYSNDGLEELYKCFQSLETGGHYYSPGFLSLMKNMGVNMLPDETRDQLKRLSSREREILRMVSDGLSGNEIADTLCISYRTLANHKTNIAQKLDLESCRHLTRFGISIRGHL